MYIGKGFTYYRGSEQRHTAAPFLLLLQLRSGPCDTSNTFAIVRKVALQQFGHYMMGSANICGKWKTVSGAYGSDGLPMTVDVLPKDAKPLPTELYDAWNKGGGWNGAGSEVAAMAEFAKTLISKR
jgi:hypothetical protein